MAKRARRIGRGSPAALAHALVVLAAGCAVGPDYVAPEPELPDAWRGAVEAELEGDTSPLQDWWKELGDPTLDALIQLAAEANLDLRAAATRIDQARALRGVAAGELLPAVGAGASAAASQPSDNSVRPPGDFDTVESYQAGFDAFWEIDVFGRIRRSIEASEAELGASIEDYRDVMVALFAEVAASYVDVRSTQARLEFARSNVESQRASLQLTRDRYTVGLTSALDPAQAESNLANTEASIPRLELGLEVALNRLALLLGEHPGAVHDLLAEPAPIPSPAPELTLGVPAELLRRRPDVRAAERRLAAQTARIGIATAALYPSFSLSGFFGLDSLDAGDLFQSESLTWTAAGGVDWNLFAGGSLRSAIEFEEARRDELLLAYENRVLAALGEVQDSLAAYHLERLRRDRLATAVAATERSVELVRTQYVAGLTDFQNYLDSQRSLFQQQDELASSEGQVVLNLIAVNKALGGGWTPPEDEMAMSATEAANTIPEGTSP